MGYLPKTAESRMTRRDVRRLLAVVDPVRSWPARRRTPVPDSSRRNTVAAGWPGGSSTEADNADLVTGWPPREGHCQAEGLGPAGACLGHQGRAALQQPRAA